MIPDLRRKHDVQNMCVCSTTYWRTVSVWSLNSWLSDV